MKTRCQKCGRRMGESGKCQSCGNAVPNAHRGTTQHLAGTLPIQTTSAIQSVSRNELSRTERRLSGASILHGTPVPLGVTELSPVLPKKSVRGRVLISSQEPTQPADLDLWRWISVPAWGLILFLFPPTAVLAVWQSAGLLAALALGVVFFALLRFVFSGRLMQSWEFVSALHGRHVVEPMPVTMLRIRTGNDREVQLRLKGHLRGGSTVVGDRVAAQGSWRHQVLHVSRLQCERTGASIIPVQPCAFRSAVSGSVVLLSMVVWLSLVGLPWFQQQYGTFSENLHRQLNSVISEKSAFAPFISPFTTRDRITQ